MQIYKDIEIAIPGQWSHLSYTNKLKRLNNGRKYLYVRYVEINFGIQDLNKIKINTENNNIIFSEINVNGASFHFEKDIPFLYDLYSSNLIKRILIFNSKNSNRDILSYINIEFKVFTFDYYKNLL